MALSAKKLIEENLCYSIVFYAQESLPGEIHKLTINHIYKKVAEQK